MKNIHDASQQEPWLTRLRDLTPTDGEVSPPDFVERVMNAPFAPNAEPWLEWMAVDRAPIDRAFAGQVAHAFVAQRAKRRVAGWIGRAAAGLAASVALAALLWPTATPPPRAPQPLAQGVAIHAPGEKASLTLALRQEAEGWVTHHTRETTATLVSTKKRASTVLAQYALPIQASCFFLGLGVPAVPVKDAPPHE